MKTKTYVYFVSFRSGEQCGHAELSGPEVTGFEQIQKMARVLAQRYNLGEVAIINYKLMRVEK